MASLLTTLTTHGRESSSDSVSSFLVPNRTTWRYVTCSLGEANSVPCSSNAASRMVTLTPSKASSFPLESLAGTGSASITAKAGPDTLRPWERFRKWKCVNRRREFRARPAGSGSPLPGGGNSLVGVDVDSRGPLIGLARLVAEPLALGMCSNRPNSSKAPSSNFRSRPNPPSTTASKTRSFERPDAAALIGASGWS